MVPMQISLLMLHLLRLWVELIWVVLCCIAQNGTDDKTFHALFEPIMAKVMEVFRPGAIVMQCGKGRQGQKTLLLTLVSLSAPCT